VAKGSPGGGEQLSGVTFEGYPPRSEEGQVAESTMTRNTGQ
jgi:hypothetical protein